MFWIITILCVLFGLVRGIEFRTPYCEMDGGLWLDLRNYRWHKIITVGVRKRSKSFGGEWSFEIDWYRGPFIPTSDGPGVRGGLSPFVYLSIQTYDPCYEEAERALKAIESNG